MAFGSKSRAGTYLRSKDFSGDFGTCEILQKGTYGKIKMSKRILNVGMCFSKKFEGKTPISHIGVKLPVYIRFLELMRNEGWNVYVFTRRTYEGNGIFNGAWAFDNGKFKIVKKPVKADLVYDRTAGVKFPRPGDVGTIWVNRLDFKILAWDKWGAYKAIGKYMPGTLLLKSENELPKISKIKSDWVVLKPFNGLKGFGIFIGHKKEALNFKFGPKYKKYIAQEFVDTSNGIPGVTLGMHDLRVAIVNGKAVWCHVRVPPEGTFTANAAQGGILTEVDYEKVPGEIKKIVSDISEVFKKEFDNPIYSLDFGLGKDGKPYIFEINDQIGFPKWEMKNRDIFLKELVGNFKSKLY